MAAPIKFGVGQSVLRKEDDALIRGKGRYTDDVAPQASLHALMLRSPHAHAKFSIDASRARTLPGVAAVGVVLAGTLWATASFAAAHFSGPLRDEAALLLLIAIGAVVYGGAIAALFGLRWLRSLVRG